MAEKTRQRDLKSLQDQARGNRWGHRFLWVSSLKGKGLTTRLGAHLEKS